MPDHVIVTPEQRTLVNNWLHAFERALTDQDLSGLKTLWLPDCHWRDVLGMHWDIDTLSGRDRVCADMLQRAKQVRPRNWSVEQGGLQALSVTHAQDGSLLVLLSFETDIGPGEGVLRLVFAHAGAQSETATSSPTPSTTPSATPSPTPSSTPSAAQRALEQSGLKAWSLMTSLVEIRGHEEKYKKRLETRDQFSRSFLGPNWLEKREKEAGFEDRDPTVLIVGGGQAGLTMAARLKQLGVDALVIDSHARIGDNWRERYRALVLHNQTFANHLPYMPFPETWPVFVPKDMLAGWLEYYATAMEINVWSQTTLIDAHFDESSQTWVANLQKNGSRVTIQPRHMILTTGVSAVPDRSPVEGLEQFKGPVIHTADYKTADPWVGKKVVVLGTGTSAHDVAQDLCEHGAHVTMVQRSHTMVQNVVPTAQKPYAMYEMGYPLHYCDMLAVGTPFPLVKLSNHRANEEARELDKELHQGLEAAGFRLNKGEDGIGWQMMFLMRGGGYYFNVGCSELISQGRIKVIALQEIQQYESTGLRLKDGSLVEADLVVVAKGYLGQSAVVEKLLGPQVASRVGPIWGINPETQELNNMWKPTPQTGLWFHAGSLAQCRIWSKYLALQIQARELGLVNSGVFS